MKQLLGLYKAFEYLSVLTPPAGPLGSPSALSLSAVSDFLGSHRPHGFDYFLVGPWCHRYSLFISFEMITAIWGYINSVQFELCTSKILSSFEEIQKNGNGMI